MKPIFAVLLGATALARAEAMPAVSAESRTADAFVATLALTPASPAEITATCDARLARVATMRAVLEHETGRATIAATLRRFDDMTLVLDAAGNDAGLLAEIAPDEPRRVAARGCQAKVGDVSTGISLSRPIYDRLAAIDAASADPVARLLLTRTLRDYRNAGVAGDAAARARIAALQSRITADGITFEGNIANGRKTISATPDELDGLPADFIAAHKTGADGRITISTDTPDYQPVMIYARSEALRHRMLDAFSTRAPANEPVLADMFAQRDTLAHALGRPNFASLALTDKMIDTPTKATALLDDIDRAAQAPSQRDLATMLARLKRIDPAASYVPSWSSAYVSQLIRKEQYAVDPQEVRRYFPYERVRDGIFQLTQDLFQVMIRPWQTPLWDPAAQAFEVVDHGEVIGRFFLDAHPRPGKYAHANVVPVRFGLEGRNLPVAALVVNFPAGGYATGLMEHRDVETFLHEYGHLLHVIFSGRQQWRGTSMGAVEWDFVEAPSQMLENWVWDYDTLKRFAADEQGHAIPAELVAKMNRARYFAEAYGDRRQLGLSNVSLAYHLGPPAPDLTATYKTAYERYAPTPMAGGLKPQDSFDHLAGYSAFYYTYMWSKAIALDLYSRFEKEGLRSPATALAYREKVLAPGGSKPAAELVRDFLGRAPSLDAYRARLAKGE